METLKATISRGEKKKSLQLQLKEQIIEINLAEDNPNNVKSAFNKLLQALKSGEIKFKLEDRIEDLYFHVSKEYITQLNAEITAVYKEMKDLELLTPRSKKAK